MSLNPIVERQCAVRAYNVLLGKSTGLEDCVETLETARIQATAGHDRYSILLHLLERSGQVKEMFLSARMLATVSRRHQDASDRLDQIGARTPQTATRYDSALAGEIALNNTLHAIMDDAEMNLSTILRMAGLDFEAADAILSLMPDKRHRYERDDEMAKGFDILIAKGLAFNVSNYFPGASRGVCLSDAGEIVWRLATGIRKLPKPSPSQAIAA